MIKIFKHYIPMDYFGLLAVEWLILATAINFGSPFYILYTESWNFSEQALSATLVFGLVFTLSFSAFGLYRRIMNHEKNMLIKRIFLSNVSAIFLLASLYYTLPQLFLGRSTLFNALLLAFTGLSLTRFLFYRFVSYADLKRRILVIGSGGYAKRLQASNAAYWHSSYVIVGYVSLENEPSIMSDTIKFSKRGDIISYAKKLKIDEIVIAFNDRQNTLPIDEIMETKLSGIPVIDLFTFYEREQRLLFLECLKPGRIIFPDGFLKKNAFVLFNKRIFDIFFSVLLLALTWWIMLIAVLAIYFEDGFGSSVIYRQVRVGKNNSLFKVLKFRSMVQNAEGNGAQWAIKNDNRVTKVGKFIRKYRIDELPQLFNVLKGEMSFVGPRPERPEFVKDFVENIPYYQERHLVKPGITGWAQLSYPYGASEEDAKRKLEYDLYYVKNYCHFLDFSIILGTVEVILCGKGAR